MQSSSQMLSSRLNAVTFIVSSVFIVVRSVIAIVIFKCGVVCVAVIVVVLGVIN